MSTSSTPLVSVILPVFNAEKYLAAAIDSLVEQRYAHIEIIIINDGSTDDSANIIAGYKDERIRVINNDGNEGLINSLNKGLKIATGEYIARFDADDINHPDRIGVQVEFMGKNEVDISGTFIRQIGLASKLVRFPVTDEDIKAAMLVGNPLVHPSIMFHRKWVDKGLYYYSPQWKHVEDYELWIRLMPVCTFANIPRPLLKYRISGDSVCATNPSEQKSKDLKLREYLLQKILPGYQLTEVEIDWLSNSNRKRSSADIRNIRELIHTLMQGNKLSSVFPQQAFLRMLMKRFYSTCLAGNNLRQEYFTSYLQLSRQLNFSTGFRRSLWLFSRGIVNSVR